MTNSLLRRRKPKLQAGLNNFMELRNDAQAGTTTGEVTYTPEQLAAAKAKMDAFTANANAVKAQQSAAPYSFANVVQPYQDKVPFGGERSTDTPEETKPNWLKRAAMTTDAAGNQIGDAVWDGTKYVARNVAAGARSLYKGATSSDALFNVVNAASLAKGLLGRMQKPPQDRYVDKQGMVATAQGMNPYVKASTQQALANTMDTALQTNQSTDARLNAASRLAANADINSKNVEIGGQDAQMLQQSQANQLAALNQDQTRMLQYEQQFKGQQDERARSNYAAQQTAAQTSINSALANKYQQLKSGENQTAANEDARTNMAAGLVTQATQRMQKMVDINYGPENKTIVVRYFDDNTGDYVSKSFPADQMEEAQKLYNESSTNMGLSLAAQKDAEKQYSNMQELSKKLNLGRFKMARGGVVNPFFHRTTVTPADRAYSEMLELARAQMQIDARSRHTANSRIR
jgi:hypothetical protein